MSRKIMQVRIWNPEKACYEYSGGTPTMLVMFYQQTAKLFTFHEQEYEYCTGLLDKDGVEIYDGDIVKLCYGIPPTFDTLLIEYADDETVADISVSGWWMRNMRKNGVSGSLCKTYENDLEVIGNIHKHPHLLETNNE